MKVTVIPILIGALGTVIKGLVQGLEDHPNYCIIEIGQNTQKSHGDLMRLAITQAPEESHSLTLV